MRSRQNSYDGWGIGKDSILSCDSACSRSTCANFIQRQQCPHRHSIAGRLILLNCSRKLSTGTAVRRSESLLSNSGKVLARLARPCPATSPYSAKIPRSPLACIVLIFTNYERIRCSESMASFCTPCGLPVKLSWSYKSGTWMPPARQGAPLTFRRCPLRGEALISFGILKATGNVHGRKEPHHPMHPQPAARQETARCRNCRAGGAWPPAHPARREVGTLSYGWITAPTIRSRQEKPAPARKERALRQP